MLFTTVQAGCIGNCFYPESELKLTCKITEVNPIRNIFTYAKVDVYGHDDNIKLTTPQGKRVKLNFGISTNKKQTWLTIKAKKSGLFSKPFNQKAFKLLFKEDQYETEAETVGFTWTDTKSNTDFTVECAKNLREVYDVPQNKRVTCINQVNNARRTIFSPRLTLDVPVEQIVNHDIAVSVSLIRSGKGYGIREEVKKNGELISIEIKAGTIDWNQFTVAPLESVYSNDGNSYTLNCDEYSAGDELPDKDLTMNCASSFERYWKPLTIANGVAYKYFKGDGFNVQIWVSKGANGYTLKFYNPYDGTYRYRLLNLDEKLELAAGEINYVFSLGNYYYYGYPYYYYPSYYTIRCKNL